MGNDGLISKRFSYTAYKTPFPTGYKPPALPHLAQAQNPSLSPELIIRILQYLYVDISIQTFFLVAFL